MANSATLWKSKPCSRSRRQIISGGATPFWRSRPISRAIPVEGTHTRRAAAVAGRGRAAVADGRPHYRIAMTQAAAHELREPHGPRRGGGARRLHARRPAVWRFAIAPAWGTGRRHPARARGTRAPRAVSTLGATSLPLPPPGPLPATDGVTIDATGVWRAHVRLQTTARRGAWQVATTRTAPVYRFYALPGGPPFRPGLVRVEPSMLRRWCGPAEHFGSFVAGIPAPLDIGKVKRWRRQRSQRIHVRVSRRRRCHRHQRARRLAAIPGDQALNSGVRERQPRRGSRWPFA